MSCNENSTHHKGCDCWEEKRDALLEEAEAASFWWKANCFNDGAESLLILEALHKKAAWQNRMLARAKEEIEYNSQVTGWTSAFAKVWLADLEKGMPE